MPDIASKTGAVLLVTQDAPGFRRTVLTRGPDGVVVDVVRDRTTQRVAEKSVVDGIRIDPPAEIVANKLCALVGRAEERDLVDLGSSIVPGTLSRMPSPQHWPRMEVARQQRSRGCCRASRFRLTRRCLEEHRPARSAGSSTTWLAVSVVSLTRVPADPTSQWAGVSQVTPAPIRNPGPSLISDGNHARSAATPNPDTRLANPLTENARTRGTGAGPSGSWYPARPNAGWTSTPSAVPNGVSPFTPTSDRNRMPELGLPSR